MGYQGAVWFMFSVGQAKVWPQQKLEHDKIVVQVVLFGLLPSQNP